MAKQYELSDASWEIIEDLITQDHGTGRPQIDDQLMLNGNEGVLCLGPAGVICLNDSDLGQRFTSAFETGEIEASSIRCSNGFISG